MELGAGSIVATRHAELASYPAVEQVHQPDVPPIQLHCNVIESTVCTSHSTLIYQSHDSFYWNKASEKVLQQDKYDSVRCCKQHSVTVRVYVQYEAAAGTAKWNVATTKFITDTCAVVLCYNNGQYSMNKVY